MKWYIIEDNIKWMNNMNYKPDQFLIPWAKSSNAILLLNPNFKPSKQNSYKYNSKSIQIPQKLQRFLQNHKKIQRYKKNKNICKNKYDNHTK